MMTGRLILVLRWSFFAAILGAGVVLAIRHRDQLAALETQWRVLLPLVVASTIAMALRGVAQQTMAAAFGVRLTLWEGMGLSAFTTVLGETLPLNAATLTKPVYLKRVHGLDYASCGVGLTVSAIIYTGAACLLAATVMVTIEGMPLLAPALMMAVAIGAWSLILVPAKPYGGLSRIAIPLSRIAVARIQWSLWVQFLLLAFVDGIRLWLAFVFVGFDPGVMTALAAAGLATLAAWLALTPGALGIVETTLWAAAALLHYEATAAVAASLVARAGVIGSAMAIAALWLTTARLTKCRQ